MNALRTLCAALVLTVSAPAALAQTIIADNCTGSNFNKVASALDIAEPAMSRAADQRIYFNPANHSHFVKWFGPNVNSKKWDVFARVYAMNHEMGDEYTYSCACPANIEAQNQIAFALPGISFVNLCTRFFTNEFDAHQRAHILIHEVSHGTLGTDDPTGLGPQPDDVAEYVEDNPNMSKFIAESYAHFAYSVIFD